MKINTSLKVKVWLLSFLHLLVDGICAYTIFNRLYITESNTIIIIVFIGYNTLAFLSQPLFGYIMDKIGNENIVLTISLIMLVVGSAFPLSRYLSLFLIGIGNAMFHIVGGKYSIYLSCDNLAYLGLFVSLGACGLALGTYLYKSIVLKIFVVLTLILGSICHFLKDEIIIVEPKPSFKISDKKKMKCIMLLILAVTIRAIIGKTTTPLFEATPDVLIVIALFASLGKAFGGILADFIGIRWTVMLTLPLALIGYFFFRSNLYIYLFSTLLFNTTMPLTLFLSNKMFQYYEGFSFGLLASVLFIGYLIGELYVYLNLPYLLLLCVSIVLTLFIILYVNWKVEKSV